MWLDLGATDSQCKVMVSIIIPCYNASAFLRQTLASVIENMAPQDEVVVVDDHSEDDSEQKAKHILQAAGVQHTVQRNPTKGACAARNHAMALAKGSLIQWLDADDILGQHKIAKQRRHLKGGSNTLVVSPFQSFVGEPRSGALQDHRDWFCPSNDTPLGWLASGKMTIPACWLGHRSVFEAAGPWDTSLHVNQDGEYFARALVAAERLHFEPDAQVWYRRGVSGSVSSFTPAKADSLFRSIASIQKTAQSIEDSPRMRQMLANKYQHAIYTAYPHCPEGMDKAKKALQALPKPTISNPNAVSFLSKGFAFVFGWKSLTRLRMLMAQFSSS